ncbi:MAG: hypothetical protein ACQETI_10875 [Halobacteriota archaeon]
MNREPAWVAAIRLAFTQGWVDVDSVVDEANLVAGRERTVRDVLSTMADRDMLRESPDFDVTGRYFVGPTLRRSAPSPAAVKRLSADGTHRWTPAVGDD